MKAKSLVLGMLVTISANCLATQQTVNQFENLPDETVVKILKKNIEAATSSEELNKALQTARVDKRFNRIMKDKKIRKAIEKKEAQFSGKARELANDLIKQAKANESHFFTSDQTGNTPFHWLVYSDESDQVIDKAIAILIKEGWDINQINLDRQTPLDKAIRQKPEIVPLLKKYGAKTSAELGLE